MSQSLKKLLIPLIQVPLFASLFMWGEEVRRRPLYSILLAGAYEVVVITGAFGKKVWDRLEDKAIQRTADWILTGVTNFAPGFRRRYKEQVIHDYGIFNVRGLGLINTFTLSLDQVFVDLRVDPSNPQKFNVDPIAQKEFAGNRQIWDFLKGQKLIDSEAAALAIIGPPGCGKTTLLQHIAVTLASNRQGRYRFSASIPVLLFLRDHVSAITQEQIPSLGKLAQSHFSDTNLFATLIPPKGWFEKRLRQGKCTVLLDGLDEVADLRQRKVISKWVDDQIRNYSNSYFVLTARPQGYRDAPLQRAHVLEVQPFNAEQVRKFIGSWYLSNEIMSSGGLKTESVKQRASKEANDLLQRLRRLPSLGALTVNPLLLTMIAMVHRYHGALPGSRVELYADICEVLLGRWKQAKGVQDNLSAAQKLVILRPLAAHMMGLKSRDISTSEALEVIALPLMRVGISDGDPETLLSELQASSGLLLEREAGHWSFAHLTFQEYLTAAHWLEQKITKEDWVELVGDSWWHETLRLYAAQGDASPLVRACLEVDTLPALTLAADCLIEARELDLELRRATEDRVIADLGSSDIDRRRLAAEVRLARRLRELNRLDDLREMDFEYLSYAEYQLFLAERRLDAQYHQPDHWIDLGFQKDLASHPITGIRCEDALAFCDWLTERVGGSVKYRVPHPDEAISYPAVTANLGAWCWEQIDRKDRYALVGLSSSSEEAIREQLRKLSALELPLPSLTTMDARLFNLHTRGTQIETLTKELDYIIDSLAKGLQYALKSKSPVELKVGLNNALIGARRLSLFIFRQHVGLAAARDLDHNVEIDPRLTKRALPLRKRAISLAAKLGGDFEPIVNSLEKDKSPDAIAIRNLQNNPNTTTSQMASILRIILELSSAEVIPVSTARAAQRTALKKTLEETKVNSELQSVWWWLTIVMAREENRLGAWEGIRVVREQSQVA